MVSSKNREPKLLVKPHNQIAGPPTHHPADRRDRPFLHQAGEKRPVAILPSLGGTPGEGMLMRPSAPCSLNRITQSRKV